MAFKGKYNNDAPDFSYIDALVNMNPENNVGEPFLELDFAFFEELPNKAKIWGI